MGYLIAIFVGVMVFIGFQYSSWQNDWNAWNRDCLEAKGVVTTTRQSFWSTRYECSINGEIVTLPGWEGY